MTQRYIEGPTAEVLELRKFTGEFIVLASFCVSLPKAGYQCGNSARWDRSGGRRVTVVPAGIATIYQFEHLSLAMKPDSRWISDIFNRLFLMEDGTH
jgi:hypothetical protein